MEMYTNIDCLKMELHWNNIEMGYKKLNPKHAERVKEIIKRNEEILEILRNSKK